ncbi:proton-coupled amino acid transporter [Acrasis kona]|uniref:Proton-coupled amino acid transporter n=1 Tax=Acrasis kona TaxID=1008807 RepID=A0AAW2Z670_9EUKA
MTFIIDESQPLVVRPIICEKNTKTIEKEVAVDTTVVVDEGTTKSSNIQAFVNTIKANIGSGILVMPYAFKNSGTILGLVTLIVVASITLHCTVLLIKCKNRLKRQNENEQIKTYGDVGKASLGRFGAVLIEILLIFTQFGFSCAYLIFIGTNVHEMVPKLQEWHAVAISVVILIPLCLVRNLKYLSPFSLISELCIIAGLIIVIYYDIHSMVTEPFPGHRGIKAFDIQNFPIFFGICIYGFEGIGLALPIEESMKDRASYPKVFYTAGTMISIIMAIFGMLGYLAFGAGVRDIITLNLPQGSVLSYIIKIGFIVALLFTYPIQLIPVSELFDNYLQSIIKFVKSRQNKSQVSPSVNDDQFAGGVKVAPKLSYVLGIVIRIVLVILTALLAVSIPAFGDFLTLIGGLGGTMLAFILPSVIHLVTFRGNLRFWIIFKDVLIILFGVSAVVVTTLQSGQHLIDVLSK